MEVFLDFGLFEAVAAIGLSAVARRVYANRVAGGIFLFASVLLPAATIFWLSGETGRWLGAASLGAALVNASVVAAALQRRDVPTLTFSRGPARAGMPRRPGKN